MKNIIVVGLGFVGSATGIAIASCKKKYQVFGLDLNSEEGKRRIDSLNNSLFPFKTNDQKLKKNLKKVIKEKNFLCTYNKDVLFKADVVLLNINFDIINNKFDLSPFKSAIRDISSRIKEKTLVIINSTVPPGCCENIVYPIIKKQFVKRRLKINRILLAHSYERVMPGKNYYDSIVNYWRVYSGINQSSKIKCKNFLQSFINTRKFPLTILENTRSSETSKVLENTYRAVNIALIEEWTKFTKLVDINFNEILTAIRLRPSHQNIMSPGIGVGGYCLTKDPKFADLSVKQIFKKKKKIDFKFSNLAISVNKKMPEHSIKIIQKALPGNIKKKKFLIFGVAYKNDVGDTRNSPIMNIYNFLRQKKAIVEYYDPFVPYWEEVKKKSIEDIQQIDKFDYFVLSVNHSVFKNIDFLNLVSKRKTFFDFANILSKKKIFNLRKMKHNCYFLGKT